jgi:hypothetical protein
MDLASLRRLLDRTALLSALEPCRGRDARVDGWLERLRHKHGDIEDSGARGFERSLGRSWTAWRCADRCGRCGSRDMLDTNPLVLFSLDAAVCPHARRKVASWILLSICRLARTSSSGMRTVVPRALLLVDEVGALGHQARHLPGLIGHAGGRARCGPRNRGKRPGGGRP